MMRVMSAPICPKHNCYMVLRTAGKGKNKGKRFWDCPEYLNLVLSVGKHSPINFGIKLMV